MKFCICFLFLVVNFSSFGASVVCENYTEPTVYTSMKKDIDQSIIDFANKKPIAAESDAFLSKLISAKSPLILSWYKKGNFEGKSETFIAEEWRRYYSQKFILMKYPHNDKKIDKEVESLVDGKIKKYFTPQYKKRLEKLFETSKSLAIETITEMALPQEKIIIERIKAIKLYWPLNLKTARNNSIPLDVIDWGVAYDPVPNEINVGLNSLKHLTDENYLAVFAHEIGHSFDSCRWGAFFEGAWPFEKVGECLRSEKSVGAKKRDDSGLEAFKTSGKISAELFESLKANPTCNKFIYPPRGTQADQLPETFADWFSAEAISRSKKIDMTQLRIDLCEDSTLKEGSSYVSNQSRQEKIYLSHPKINALIQKKEVKVFQDSYCEYSPIAK